MKKCFGPLCVIVLFGMLLSDEVDSQLADDSDPQAPAVGGAVEPPRVEGVGGVVGFLLSADGAAEYPLTNIEWLTIQTNIHCREKGPAYLVLAERGKNANELVIRAKYNRSTVDRERMNIAIEGMRDFVESLAAKKEWDWLEIDEEYEHIE